MKRYANQIFFNKVRTSGIFTDRKSKLHCQVLIWTALEPNFNNDLLRL
jgi:hypothetical protein